jgi:hypothetical protein
MVHIRADMLSDSMSSVKQLVLLLSDVIGEKKTPTDNTDIKTADNISDVDSMIK